MTEKIVDKSDDVNKLLAYYEDDKERQKSIAEAISSNETITQRKKAEEVTAEDLLKTVYKYHKPNMTFDEVMKFYEEWAKDGRYDADTHNEHYLGPAKAAEGVADFFNDKNDRATVRILDVGAGTGIVAEILKEYGFNNMDALDPSQPMLDEAKKKGLYKFLYAEKLGDRSTTLKNGSYDGIATAGAMTNGHMPSNAMEEMVDLVRAGGVISITLCEEKLRTLDEYVENFEPLLKRLQDEGRMKIVRREIFKNYFCGLDGLLLVMEVLK